MCLYGIEESRKVPRNYETPPDSRISECQVWRVHEVCTILHSNTSCLHINSDVNKSVKTGHKTAGAADWRNVLITCSQSVMIWATNSISSTSLLENILVFVTLTWSRPRLLLPAVAFHQQIRWFISKRFVPLTCTEFVYLSVIVLRLCT